MLRSRNGRGFSSANSLNSSRVLTSEELPTKTSTNQQADGSNASSSTSDINPVRRNPHFQVNSGVVRHHGNRNRGSSAKDTERQPNLNYFNPSSNTNVGNNINHRFPRNNQRTPQRNNFANNATASGNTTTKKPSQPPVKYDVLDKLLNKQPDEILDDMLNPNFQLKNVLNDKRMRDNFTWISTMTRLIEQITKCTNSREKIATILLLIPRTSYIEGVYSEIHRADTITNKLRYSFIQSFLKIAITFLSTTPHLADGLTKIFERVELYLGKNKSTDVEYEDTKAILDELLELVNDLDRQKESRKQDQKAKRHNDSVSSISDATTTTNDNQFDKDINPPPDDYRDLQIIPNIDEILSEDKIFLRKNIINGVYEDPQHYLDIHFRLLREDFLGPLRDGMDQYLSRAEGKNFNVRIYENVHSLGPRLCQRSGIVYDLLLDPKMARRIAWANSRRLMFGNLLVLTYDKFQSCAFATVENRDRLEKDLIVSIKALDKLNMNKSMQIDLDEVQYSQQLTVVETMTYFEAYRPVLIALQSIDINQPFPLAPFLLKLTNENIAPDYVKPSTTYDFTPLLVDPNSEVKTRIINPEISTDHNRRFRNLMTISYGKVTQITYKEHNRVPARYKAVSLLSTDQWPTSDELHLNPKQREALILALTHKVALIQGPPGTGKTFLGVRIAEMLLHNRSVWCPPYEQSTPILMICHTNHALDQFLELIIKRLQIKEGIIRVGNRCQNPTIKPFSLLDARRSARENRSIPREIYHLKHQILDKKAEAEEALKIHQHTIEQSRTHIILLSSLIELDLIDDQHCSSLLAPYNGMPTETVLSDWLGITYEYQETFVDPVDTEMLNINMENMNIDDNQEEKVNENEETKQNTDHGKQNDNNIQEETEQNAGQTDNKEIDSEQPDEEDEEEDRRRDEIDMYDDNDDAEFTKVKTKKSEKTQSKSKSNKKPKKSTKDDNNDEEEWQVVQKRPYDRRRMIQNIIQCPTTLDDQKLQQINGDLWKLSLAQRYDLYRYWLFKYQQYLHDSVREARHAYNEATSKLAEYHQQEDCFIMKDSIIVAMTTTCAAKYHNVLEQLQSKIVIVEEAAAIFEAHIITALSTKCEHLILIGDHVQLRPSPSVYNLARKYNMDVSLFERFIKNNFPNVRLNIQHRMRPEIAAIMKHFYDDLADHESVKTDRPSIQGVMKDVYFINHSNMETTVTDGSSKRNDFEAKYVIALAEYLIKQGYSAEKITILVMYLGQRQFIAKEAKKIKLLHGIRIMVTDNYQGEENDIVILSLVRSNAEKQIGFLKIHNRICVALSRARCGLFVIGNMNLLAEVEPMWKRIVKSLADAQQIGTGLQLCCRQHPQNLFIADKPEAFLKRPEGGCDKACDFRLKCGHQCSLMCHNYDFEHKEIACRKKCTDTLPCGHPCTKRCHLTTPNQHSACRVPVRKVISTCGHEILFQCAQTPTIDDCEHVVQKRLRCDHIVNIPCHIASSPSKLKRYSCPEPCKTMLACKHKCAGTCGKCQNGRLHLPCQSKCERSLICSHVCKASCSASCPPCFKACQTRCVHSKCQKKCGELCVPCKEPCSYKCKHLQCTRLCSQPCNRGPCNEPCDKKLKCGHNCIGMCGEPCPKQCRICNKHVVQEIIFGTEDEPDARFVLLPDCNHIIEVTALDRYVAEPFNNQSEDTALRFPECPLCKQSIRRCTRYMPIINRVHNLIAQVKEKILGGQSEKEIDERRQKLMQEFQKTESNLKEINLFKEKDVFRPLSIPGQYFTDGELTRLNNILLFLNEIDKLLIDGRKKLRTDTFDDLVSVPLNLIVKYLFAYPQYRNFAEQQINDIEAELSRVNRLIFIEALMQSLEPQQKNRKLKQDEQDNLDTMQYLVKKMDPFTQTDMQKFDSLAKKVEHLNNLPGLGITDRERVAIVAALNLARGHWYVCPKGHPYVITECGGANQESRCPECGEKIGGQNHQLLSTNRHFGLMDNSDFAAWSDEANLHIPPPM